MKEVKSSQIFFSRFLDMHMYVTSALQRTDMKAVGLQLALDLLHEKVIEKNKTNENATFIQNFICFFIVLT